MFKPSFQQRQSANSDMRVHQIPGPIEEHFQPSADERAKIPIAGVESQSFLVLFCDEVDCLAQDYEAKAFWRLLPWHSKAIGFVFRKLNPDFFVRDVQFIHALGKTRNPMEAITQALEFREWKRQSFFRNWLGVGVSAKKAVRLARQYFASHHLVC